MGACLGKQCVCSHASKLLKRPTESQPAAGRDFTDLSVTRSYTNKSQEKHFLFKRESLHIVLDKVHSTNSWNQEGKQDPVV